MHERQIIARLRDGDIDALEPLVRQYQTRAVRAATLITHDRALAEDLVQAAFIRAYERIHQFDPARPFGPWFLRSVANDAVKAVTRRAPQPSLDQDALDPAILADPAPIPDELVERAETHAAVWDALAQLPPEQRAALVLRYYLGLTDAEIAREQDAPPGTVKWRLHQARERLRKLLAPWWLARTADDHPDPVVPPGDAHSQGEII